MTMDGKIETRRTMVSPLWTALGRRFGRVIHVFGSFVLIQLATMGHEVHCSYSTR